MDADDQMGVNNHLRIARLVLNIVGLWPYEHGCVNNVKRLAFVVTTMSEAVFQVIGFMDEDKSWDNIINYLINVSLHMIVITKFVAYLLNIDNIRKMFHKVEAQRNEITDPEERKIIYRQDLETVLWNRALLVSVFLSAFFLTTYCFLEMSFPNSLSNTIKVYYFPNNHKLSYFKFLHMYVTAMMLGITAIGYDCTTIVTCLHASGLFRLTKYRCEVAFNKSEGISLVEQQRVETQYIRGIVDMHVQGMEFIHYIHAASWKMYFSTHGLIIIAASLCLMRSVKLVFSYFTVLSSI